MEHQEIVDKLLIPAWSGIPSEYKARYARNIWEQFEAQIKSAAYTSSLPRFFETLVQSLAIQIRRDDAAGCSQILNSHRDRAVLKALRDETTTLVLMARIANDQSREQWKLERARDTELDRALAPGEPLLYTEEEIEAMRENA